MIHCLVQPSHYLYQCWLVINQTPRNTFQWNKLKIPCFSLKKIVWNMSSAKQWLFCSGLNISHTTCHFIVSLHQPMAYHLKCQDICSWKHDGIWILYGTRWTQLKYHLDIWPFYTFQPDGNYEWYCLSNIGISLWLFGVNSSISCAVHLKMI